MKTSDLFEISLKILGIYFLVKGLQHFILSINHGFIVFSENSTTELSSVFSINNTLVLLSTSAIYVFVSIVLLRKSGTFAKKVFPNEVKIFFEANWEKKLFLVGVKFLGLYIFIESIVGIFKIILDKHSPFRNVYPSELVSVIIQPLIGIYLLIGYNLVNNLFVKIFSIIKTKISNNFEK